MTTLLLLGLGLFLSYLYKVNADSWEIRENLYGEKRGRFSKVIWGIVMLVAFLLVISIVGGGVEYR